MSITPVSPTPNRYGDQDNESGATILHSQVYDNQNVTNSESNEVYVDEGESPGAKIMAQGSLTSPTPPQRHSPRAAGANRDETEIKIEKLKVVNQKLMNKMKELNIVLEKTLEKAN